ncbi:heterokaryon incompatibility protein-domain-containing protein [Diaporthe sp. PMI_573]|nr:heterokaryon incompatibility protein-domain-containing protein [Diaporthaceae sp. PMI_573]
MSSSPYRALKPQGKRIRIIHLLPRASAETFPDNGASQTPVCTISYTSLDRRPSYHALSYAWGDARVKSQILMDNSLHDVTTNLHSALLHLTPETEPLTLWIDALCINQLDEIEKTEQVAQMGDIYQHATSVITWLGPASENSDAAMSWIWHHGSRAYRFGIGNKPELRLQALLHRLESEPESLPGQGMREFLQQLSRDLSPSAGDIDGVQSALASFFNRPYWKRVWVVQEIMQAKSLRFVCGSKGVTEDMLHHAVRLVRNYCQYVSTKPSCQPLSPGPAVPFIDTRSAVNVFKVRRAKGPYPLAYLIRTLRDSIATDPRDKIFALLGFSRDNNQLGIQPDYRKQCKHVYIETVSALFKSGDTDLLSLCSHQKVIEGLPSWVPDFSTSPIRAHLQERALNRSAGQITTVLQPRFSASGNIALQPPTFELATSVMTINSILIGEVKTIGSLWQPRGWNHWLQELLMFSKNTLRPGQTHNLEDIWRTAVADQEIRQGSQKPRLSDSLLCKVQGELEIGSDIERPSSSLSSDTEQYLYELQRLAHDRRPFVTSCGRLGIGPGNMMPTDCVFVLMGVNLPLILRQTPSETWELIGDAYIHGIMDGQAVTNPITWNLISIR